MEATPQMSTFWRGKRVFITGHTGFKGSWLSLWLQQMGAQVYGYSLEAPTTPSHYELSGLRDLMTSTIGDVRDLEALKRAMDRARPDVVFHMAAQALVRASYADPVVTYAVNVMGTVHVLEALRSCSSVQAAVMITTDKCYENREWVWGYREDEPMGGHDPYSNSKGCAELATSAYRRSFFEGKSAVRVATARAGNVIGGGDFAQDRLIPDIVRSVQSGKPLDIRNPSSIRPWQHVLEPLSGYLRLAERLCSPEGETYAEGWNFGPKDEDAWTVGRVVQVMAEEWAEMTSAINLGVPSELHEAKWLKLDISKARHKLAWAPRLPLRHALNWTTTWYRAFCSGKDVAKVSSDQIRAFMALD